MAGIDAFGTSGADTTRVPQAVAQQAVKWWMLLQSPALSAAQRAAWQQWRAADAEHERAWQRVEAVSGQLAGVSGPLARAALAGPAALRRRRSLQLLTALVVVGGTAALLREQAVWQTLASDESTAVGQRRTLTLADGSTLMLNTGSAVNIVFDPERRVVQLVRGEIWVQTAADPLRRPFLVQTMAGSVRAIGTRFTVLAGADAVNVNVLQGAVELQPVDAPHALQLLQAGETGDFTRTQASSPKPMGDGAGAWAEGVLVATQMRLDDFLAELSRYRRGRLSCDPAIAALRVSGVYPLGDTDRVLAALTSALPVELHSFTRYWVRLRPQQQPPRPRQS
ncbi:FecR domain-containing protein [Variovorax sp. HJSM1_2]|uniref:FecR domain-containing protein n=1 Tax=Variovorax sp. HJSM1_2 TaxID=3366263 RepID=UPI003BD43224